MRTILIMAALVASTVVTAEQSVLTTNKDGNNTAKLTCLSDRPICKLEGERIEAEFGTGLAVVYKATWHATLLTEEPFAYVKTFNHAGNWCATIMMEFAEENYYVNLETMAHGPQQWVCSGGK